MSPRHGNLLRSQRRLPDEQTRAREDVETRWQACLNQPDDWASCVTAENARDEPFHRWLVFKQAFSPELVRRFLQQADGLKLGRKAAPLLDPFSGVGTFVVECARQDVPAVGVEALGSLAFVASAKAATDAPPLPELSGCGSWQAVAERLTLPIHRAALICAVARQHSADGKPLKNAEPITNVIANVIEMMRQDVSRPSPHRNAVHNGDARSMPAIADASIGGILTSPPYLSRHDYTKVAAPCEAVYNTWYPHQGIEQQRLKQIRAHPKAYQQQWTIEMPPAVIEACDALETINQRKLAGLVRSYFQDVFQALGECSRVLQPGAPCWVVVGGARLKDVYIPTDTILADFAQSSGFPVRDILVARNLVPSGRKFGRLTNVAPRESILRMTRT